MSVRHWIISTYTEFISAVLLPIDGVRIKSLNFFSGTNFEMACGANGRCSHSCEAKDNGFNCHYPPDYQCPLNCNGQSCMQTCRSGKCDLECNGPHCKQICNHARAVCSLKCNETDCEQECLHGKCGLDCTGGKCTQICRNHGGQCSLICKGEDCVQTCEGDRCSLECDGKHCEQTCKASDACSLECLQGNCNQKCYHHYNLECRGERCTQDCSVVVNSCQLQCPVLSDPTRCRQDCPPLKEHYCNKRYISTTKAPSAFSGHYHSCTGE